MQNPTTRHTDLIQKEQYDEALKHAFQLDYEHPDDNNVKRVLAWCLMHTEKKEQAVKKYGELTKSEDAVKDDFLNAGYSQWIMGQTTSALALFRQFVAMVPNNKGLSLLQEEFNKETLFLSSHGIDKYQRIMMIDAI